jgi:hypothetical protein
MFLKAHLRISRFNIKYSTFCSHSVSILQWVMIISPYSINRLDFLIEVHRILCEARTEYLWIL